MLIGIIKNLDNTYEYLFKNENILEAFHVDENGFRKSDEYYIKSLLSKIRYNPSCEYLTKFRDYDVYYDYKTQIKHFLKNEKEDYDMLFKYNGVDACLYSDNEKIKSITKMFLVCGLTAIISSSGFLFLMDTCYDINPNVSVYTSHRISDLKDMQDYEPITYKDAINYINASNLPDNIKEVIANEDLLKLVFSYYKDSSLEYSARLKFENLRMERVDESYSYYEVAGGYYNPLTPNVVYIKDGNLDNRVAVIHEFIHLIQAEGSSYSYLKESFAELMACELLGVEPTTYKDAVDNLKLLINIIGPEPVYELILAGDDNSLNEILDKYLTKKDIMELKHHFGTTGINLNNADETHKAVQDKLFKLYNNIYGHDISENEEYISIFADKEQNLGNKAFVTDNRTFLIPSNMKDEETVMIHGIDKEKLCNTGVIEKNTCYKEYFKIENPNIEMYYNSPDIVLKEEYNSSKYIIGKVIIDEDEIYYRILDTPILKEDYNLYYFLMMPGKKCDIKAALANGHVGMYKVSYSDKKTNDNQQLHTEYFSNDDCITLESENCVFKVKGIKARFQDQYDKLMDRINNESYHK